MGIVVSGQEFPFNVSVSAGKGSVQGTYLGARRKGMPTLPRMR